MHPRKFRRPWDLGTWLYNLALLLVSPALLLWLAWRLLIRHKGREGLKERLGFLPKSVIEVARGEDPVVWFHAVSVGEVAAAASILHEFSLREPHAAVVLSTTTSTGRQMAARCTEVQGMFYFPFDLVPIPERVLETLRPAMLVLVEGELWPNLLAAARRREISVAVVNARFSDRAFARARLVRPLYRWVLRSVDLICAQSEQDAERYRTLGADPTRVHVTGNTKFDERFPEVSPAEAAHLKLEFGFPPEAPLLVAGSTHPGEDEVILEAFSHLRAGHPDLELVLAPRHPERADSIHESVEHYGFAVYRRSHAQAGQPQPEPAGPQARVAILDTIGELARVYAMATVVFVGGSLVPKGGHNILQPLAQGKPVLTGPYMHNFRDVFDLALRAKAVWVVKDAAELADAVEVLLRSPDELAAWRERGLQMIAEQRGASARIADALVELLHSHGRVGSAQPR
ncbi:MAG: 3-deoxy-D-manno-octulosonic acid transferase [Armatimonadetes bacterium]|nr:3-deoxy-D-manno-octulosonic acid transferase [Armatimonadota bacterium]